MFRNYLFGSLLASISAMGMVSQEAEPAPAKKEVLVQFKMPPNPMDEFKTPEPSGNSASAPAWLQSFERKADEATKIFEESKKELQELLKTQTQKVSFSEERFREILREELNNFKPKAYSTVSGGGGSSGTYTPSTPTTTVVSGGSSGTSSYANYPSTVRTYTTRPAILPRNRVQVQTPAASETCVMVNGVKVCN